MKGTWVLYWQRAYYQLWPICEHRNCSHGSTDNWYCILEMKQYCQHNNDTRYWQGVSLHNHREIFTQKTSVHNVITAWIPAWWKWSVIVHLSYFIAKLYSLSRASTVRLPLVCSLTVWCSCDRPLLAYRWSSELFPLDGKGFGWVHVC